MKTLARPSFNLPAIIIAVISFALAAVDAQVTADSAAKSGPAPGVQPRVAGVEEDILDIRGPIHIPASSFSWMFWSAGALAAIGIGTAAWILIHRPRRMQPYEIALEKLAATRPLMERETAEPFSLAVSEIVRLFIEECLPVRAAHRTTSEFLHDLVNLPDSPLTIHRDALADFLKHCDLAKFARWSLTIPQMEAMLTSASTFVVAIGKPDDAKAKTPDRNPPLVAATAHA